MRTCSYEVHPGDVAEAMILAGAAAQRVIWRKGVSILVSAVYFTLMVLGGIVLALVARFLIFGSVDDGLLPFVAGGMLGGGFALFWYRRLIAFMAADFVATPFNDGPQTMTMTADGLRLTNGTADWQTRWGGVHALRLGKRTLTFCIAGIALHVPIGAIGTREEAEALLREIEGWRAAG